MFGGLKNLANIMQQAGEIKGKVAAARERVGRLQSEGSAGPDLVRIVVSGEMTVLSVSIDQNLIASGNRQALKRLRRGDFVNQMAIDVQQDRSIVLLVHHMSVPNFFVQCFSGHCCVTHSNVCTHIG